MRRHLRLLAEYRRTPDEQLGTAGASMAGLVGGVFLAGAAWRGLLQWPHPAAPTLFVLAFLAAWVVARSAHEIVHGLVYWIRGKKASLRLGWPAWAVAEGQVSRNHELISLVAPFAVLTTVALAGLVRATAPLEDAFWALLGGLNALGSAQDLREVWLVARWPARSVVEDRPEALRVFMAPAESERDEEAQTEASRRATNHRSSSAAPGA